MVKIVLKTILSLLAFTIVTFSYAQDNSESNKEETSTLTVIVKYKSQPEKPGEALSALTSLIQEVKKEPNFVNIKVLVDPADKTNILLYEEWSDESYYKGDHMSTPHLQKFMKEARIFLAGPPDITFWKLDNSYTVD